MTDSHSPASAGPTPGPWRYSMSYGRYGYGGEPDGEYIITGSGPHGGHVYPILGRTHNWPKNAEANARLIAAAPDLLAALKLAQGHLTEQLDCKRCHPIGHCPVLDSVTAAIAKAEGAKP